MFSLIGIKDVEGMVRPCSVDIVGQMPGGNLGGRRHPNIIEGMDVIDESLDQEYPSRGSCHFGAQLQDKTGAEFPVGIELGNPVR